MHLFSELSQFEQEALDAHNYYRNLHATPPLIYNTSMLADCQAWADVLAPRGEMEHSETKNGENIWYKWSSGEMEFTGKDSADAWYSEIKDYDYNNPGFASETGHFTQLLWKDTNEMAIAYSVSGQTAIAVAHYSPAGNITNEGYFERNVLPLAAPPAEPEAETAEAEPEEAEAPAAEAEEEAPPAEEPVAEPEEPAAAEPEEAEAQPEEAAAEPEPPAAEPEEEAAEPVAPEEEVSPPEESPEAAPVVATPPEAAEEVTEEAAPAAVEQPADQEMSPFESEALDAHNHYRVLHEAPPLQYSYELRDECRKWAEYLSSTGAVEESRTKNGENLWSSTEAEVTGKDPVIAWYDEINDYDFNSPGFSALTGQFSQMIWVATTHVGIASVKSEHGTFVVAQYSPVGNLVDRHSFQINVRPMDSQSVGSREKAEQDSQRTASDDGTAEMSSFEKEALEAHNQYRAHHNTAPLTFNREMSKDCSVWANVLTQDGVIAQSPTNFGENIWSNPSITEGEIKGNEAVDHWYSEIKYYDYENPAPSTKTEHFTQLIWQETTDMGIAYVVSDKGAFVVAQYKTRGNTTDAESFATNVQPLDPSFSKPEPSPEDQPAEEPAQAASPPTEEPAAEEQPAEEPGAEEKPAEEPAAEEKTAEELAAEAKAAEEPEAEGKPSEEPAAALEQAPPKEEKKKAHRHCPRKKDPKLKKAERSPCE
ncbi:uncharacterized protein LOC144608559 [Rhinoraja longicauda]